MYYPCPHGRNETYSLASMNIRSVVDRGVVTYHSVPPSPSAGRPRSLSSFQPRDPRGGFVTYALLREAIDAGYEETEWICDQAQADEFLEVWEDCGRFRNATDFFGDGEGGPELFHDF